MKIRKILYAENGKILTDGTEFGHIVTLEVGRDESEYYEITEAEYAEILKKREAEYDNQSVT